MTIPINLKQIILKKEFIIVRVRLYWSSDNDKFISYFCCIWYKFIQKEELNIKMKKRDFLFLLLNLTARGRECFEK